MGDHSLGERELLLNNSSFIDEGPGFELFCKGYYAFLN